ncbi:MAG: sulfite exporter TauE/SafE family protein [Candidatus Doudnabacteria bacterium]|nr:sulfite exporter TauE/SafE family protein [Candidatus Doudnabacteria bacterium]
MIEFGLPLIGASFIAGLFTFFAPCTLPLVPAFLGIISGVSPGQLTQTNIAAELRKRVLSNALFYILGFSLIFILFGVAFSFLGKIVILRIWLSRIGGILVILFGLVLLGVLRIPIFEREFNLKSKIPKLLQQSSKTNSFGIGALFALGWSPCVGPLLGSILVLAAANQTIVQGTFLLVVFSAGLAIPFLLTALLIGRAYTGFGNLTKNLRIINALGGIFLIALGALLVSDQFIPVFNELRGYFTRFEPFNNFIEKYL